MNNSYKKVYYLTEAGMIAAIYAILTYLGTVLNFSFGIMQFRISEALTILPIFTPAAIPGLAIGCLISNIASPFGLLDMIVGSLATLLAAILTRKLRNVCTVKKIPILSILSPVIVNAMFVPLVIALSSGASSAITIYTLGFCSIGISELLSCFILGIPLIYVLRKGNLYCKIFK